MKYTKFLSAEEKDTGVKHLNSFQKFNGIGFNFLGDTSISLLAIFFGANNVELGYLSSILFVSGVLLLVVPKLFAGKNYSKLYFWAWVARGFCCLLYSALWFTTGKTAVLIILIAYTLFCSTRIVGVALFHPIIKMTTNSKNRGEVIAKLSISFQVSVFFAKVLSFVVTSIEKLAGASGILLLQYIGIVFNTLASITMKKIPCREKITYKKGNGIIRTFVSAMKKKELRTAIFLNWANVCLIILLAFIVPFLRIEVGLSTSMIFLYSIIIVVSTIIAGYFNKFFSDRLGNKPLLFVGFSITSICFLIWSMLPPGTSFFVLFPLSLVTGFAINANSMLVNGVVIRNLPETDSVSYNAMINFIVALISIIVGTGGGILADNFINWNLPGANSYTLTFVLAVIISVFGIIASLALSEPDSRSKREVIGILLSPSNLQSFRLISKLEKERDPVNRKTILLHIGKTDNALTTEELRLIMANPYSTDKGEIIKSLFNFPRKKILPDLLRVAENPSSMYREEAIFALGAYPEKETKTLLEKLLFNTDPKIQSNAAKSLGRIGCKEYLEEIREQSKKSSGILNKMNYIIALKNMDKGRIYLEEIFENNVLQQNIAFRQAVYSLHSDILNFKPPLDGIYQKRNLIKGSGLNDFFDEARDVPAFLEHSRNFKDWLDNENIEALCKKCASLLINSNPDKKLYHLKNAIVNLPHKGRDYDDALAVLFFTYHLLKSDILV